MRGDKRPLNIHLKSRAACRSALLRLVHPILPGARLCRVCLLTVPVALGLQVPISIVCSSGLPARASISRASDPAGGAIDRTG
jgi:hypothetical protein